MSKKLKSLILFTTSLFLSGVIITTSINVAPENNDKNIIKYKKMNNDELHNC